MFHRLLRRKTDIAVCLLAGAGVVLMLFPPEQVSAARVVTVSALAPLFAALPAPGREGNKMKIRDGSAVSLKVLRLKAEAAKLRELLSCEREKNAGAEALLRLYNLKNISGAKESGANQDLIEFNESETSVGESTGDASGLLDSTISSPKNTDTIPGGVAAEIILRPVYKARALYVIDKGSGDGVEAGAGVVCAGVVIGRIVAVGQRASLLAPLGHPACRIPARIRGTEAAGMIEAGEGKPFPGKAELKFVPVTTPVETGDEAVTSGLDGAFPPGILIGSITEVRDPDALFHKITLRVALSAENAREVWVLKRRFMPFIHEKQGELDLEPEYATGTD